MSEPYYIQDTLPGMGRELDIASGYTCPWCPREFTADGGCRCLEELEGDQ
jgi:hypothetical protein